MSLKLIVATSAISESALREQLADLVADDDELLVIAPASELSRLDWLTNAEDDARDEAQTRADRVADAVPGEPVDARAGDSDPVQAIEDALRTFPADELVIVTRPDEDAGWLEKGSATAAEERFALPVTRVVLEPGD